MMSGQTAEAYYEEAAGSNAFIYEVLVDHGHIDWCGPSARLLDRRFWEAFACTAA